MSDVWLGATFFTVVLIMVLLAGYLYQRIAERRSTGVSVGLTAGQGLPSSRVLFLDLFRSIGENFPAARDDSNPYRKRLAGAGYAWPSALAVFYGIKCTSAFLLAGIFGIFTILYRGDPSLSLLPMLCGLGIGFLLPDRVLATRVRARSQRLRSALPPALDLMVLGLEAGQSLDQSIADASRGLHRTHPDLSAELAQLFLELRTGSRVDSFRNFGARTREPELRKLANLLVDSDRFGASIGPALRSHAKYLRTRFRQQAQERARKVAVKLIFPVFFLIFPSVLLVTLGPAVILMYQQLRNLMQ
ncbi:MAG TPA: type II secretion system F family protein [Bryobacteraceae bacterium]|nr:type II secretion system F family protein [Bryobacteraceae bacterium]